MLSLGVYTCIATAMHVFIVYYFLIVCMDRHSVINVIDGITQNVLKNTFARKFAQVK